MWSITLTEMALFMIAQNMPTKEWIAHDPIGFLKMVLKENPFEPFDVDDIGGWLKALPLYYSVAIIWYFKMKPLLSSSGGTKLFQRAFTPSHEARDRDAPRSWVTVARRVLGQHVPPRSGSVKEVYNQIFDFLQREETESLMRFTRSCSMQETGIATNIDDFEFAAFI